MKKLVSLLLVIFLAACAATPAPSPDAGETPPPPPSIEIPELSGDPERSAAPERTTMYDTREIRWLIPVLMNEIKLRDARARVAEMLTRINAKLESHELQLSIELREITLTRELWPPDWRYEKRHTYSVTNDIADILTSKEEFDLISVPTGHASVTRLADMGLLRNIASEMYNYPALMDVLDPQQLEILRYSNGIWGVPAGFDAKENLVTPYLAYNTATADTLGIFDAEELGSAGDLLHAADRAANSDIPNAMYIDFSFDAYRREYPQYPFKVSEDFVFLYTQDGQVEPYAGSDVMTADLDLANRIWRVNRTPGHEYRGVGLGLNMARDEMMRDKAFDFIQGLRYVSDEQRSEYAPLLLADDKPNILYHNPYGTIVNVVPSQATAYGLMLLNLIYSDQSIYEEFRDTEELFGAGESARLGYGLSPAVSVYRDRYVSLWEYMSGRVIDIHHFNLFDCVKQSRFDPDEAALHYGMLIEETTYTPMPWDGFVFDPTPVLAEYAHVAERSWGCRMESANEQGSSPETCIPDIFIGLHEVSDLGVLASEIYNAGLDAVLEECRRQYAVFLANKDWTAPEPIN